MHNIYCITLCEATHLVLLRSKISSVCVVMLMCFNLKLVAIVQTHRYETVTALLNNVASCLGLGASEFSTLALSWLIWNLDILSAEWAVSEKAAGNRVRTVSTGEYLALTGKQHITLKWTISLYIISKHTEVSAKLMEWNEMEMENLTHVRNCTLIP